MKLLRTLITASALMLPALASAQDVKIDFDKAFDFSTVKTYSIAIGTKWGNDLSERRVLTEIDEAITAKGWKKVDAAQANAIVVLHGATQTKKSANTFYSGMGSAQTVVSEWAVGTLVVDMFDAKNKQLIFRGTAEDEISDNPEKNAKRLEKASTKLFKDFPPKAKTK